MTPAQRYLVKNAKPGDILAFSGNELLSDTINICSYGIPRLSISHVGLLCDVDGEFLLFHSLIESPRDCVIRKRRVDGVQANPAVNCLYDGGRVWHYPLHRQLYTDEASRLRRMLISTTGVPYDRSSAWKSGGVLVSTVFSLLKSENKNQFFCSEFVADMLDQIGVFPNRNYSSWSPNALMRRLRREGLVKPPKRLVPWSD